MQFESWTWGAGGGAPWHDVQVDWVPLTRVHSGAVALPPAASVAPWQ
jgi:hypothetical protein